VIPTNKVFGWLRVPVFSSLVRHPRVAAIMLLGAGIAGGSQALGIPVWRCPLKTVTGLDCPGCGLTRGTLALFEWRWPDALESHLFSPLVPLVVATVGIILIAPAPARPKIIATVELVENKTFLGAFITLSFLVYSLTRMLSI